MVDQTILEYLGDRQASKQWKGFLNALVQEFASQLSEADLRALMRRVGSRFAEQSPLAECRTLDDVQFAMSKIWMANDWGWVTVEEENGSLRLSHNCSPLRAAFGQNASPWAPAFLEGAYQQWFEQLGSGKHLGVQQTSELDTLGCVEFRLGR
ncbi:cellulose synthase [Pigmentiphaga sp. NML080357]|uniref:cellulose biosynthesis protein BcsD n=1 Tax=Pigmentiphaga sp. NML080357 TaxID=2008675 RepID=UPI000B413DC5|nr:cellulose biosynthesis protein BcsD [Pigmentiphaga sp. NML080357]OVZ63802.1 cellulose synthase [Pigmentiphaga sp. NML080357]